MKLKVKIDIKVNSKMAKVKFINIHYIHFQQEKQRILNKKLIKFLGRVE